MPDGIRYRAPGWWTLAGLGMGLVGGLGVSAGARWPFIVGTFGLAAVTLFVSRRSWAHLSADGLEVCPNGLRVVRVRWDDVRSVVGNRVVLTGGRRVTMPPLAGDPLAHVRAELDHRGRAPRSD